MDINNFIKSCERPQEEVINRMASCLNDDIWFASKVCTLLDDYFYDWAAELVDFEEEYVDEIGENTESVEYQVDKDGDILKTTYFLVDNFYDELIDRSEEWGNILSGIADKDDDYYGLYYKMVDYNIPQIRNSVSLIINDYFYSRIKVD